MIFDDYAKRTSDFQIRYANNPTLWNLITYTVMRYRSELFWSISFLVIGLVLGRWTSC